MKTAGNRSVVECMSRTHMACSKHMYMYTLGDFPNTQLALFLSCTTSIELDTLSLLLDPIHLNVSLC